MAILHGGITGHMTGRLGNNVGSRLYGKNTLKTYRNSINDRNSAAQIAQRSAFKSAFTLAGMVNSQICIPLLKRFFKGMSAYNAFVKLNTSAFDATGELIGDNLQIAKGKLFRPAFSVVGLFTNKIVFQAAPVSDPFALSTDILYLLVMDGTKDEKGNPVLNFAGSTGKTRAQLEAAETDVILSTMVLAPTAWVYTAWLRADGSQVSDTTVSEETI